MDCFYFWCRYYVNLCAFLCWSCECPQVSESFPSVPSHAVWTTLLFCSGSEVGPIKPPLSVYLRACSSLCVCSLLLSYSLGTEFGTIFYFFSDCLKKSVFLRWKICLLNFYIAYTKIIIHIQGWIPNDPVTHFHKYSERQRVRLGKTLAKIQCC